MKLIYLTLIAISGYLFTLTASQNVTNSGTTTPANSNNSTSPQTTQSLIEGIGNILDNIITAIRNFVSFLITRVEPPIISLLQDFVTLATTITNLVKSILNTFNISGEPVFSILSASYSIASRVLDIILQISNAIESLISTRSKSFNSLRNNFNTKVQGYLKEFLEKSKKIADLQNGVKHHHIVNKKSHHHQQHTKN